MKKKIFFQHWKSWFLAGKILINPLCPWEPEHSPTGAGKEMNRLKCNAALRLLFEVFCLSQYGSYFQLNDRRRDVYESKICSEFYKKKYFFYIKVKSKHWELEFLSKRFTNGAEFNQNFVNVGYNGGSSSWINVDRKKNLNQQFSKHVRDGHLKIFQIRRSSYNMNHTFARFSRPHNEQKAFSSVFFSFLFFLK